MFRDIKESDWKYLRNLKQFLLERACSGINQETKLVLNNVNGLSQYEVYISLYEHIEKKDKIIADCFNDYKRSKAIEIVLNLLRYELITDEEIQGFSDETKEIINKISDV